MNWINAREERKPELFGKYFVKINKVKQIISLHEFDFYLERGEEIVWLEEVQDLKKSIEKSIRKSYAKDVQMILPEEEIKQPAFDRFKHILLEEHNRQVFVFREKVISLKEEVKTQRRCIDELNQEISILKKQLFTCSINESVPQVEVHLKKDYSMEEFVQLKKLEVKKFLIERFSYNSAHFGLVRVRELFPEIKNQPQIPKYLLTAMIDIYTKTGVKIINEKVKQAYQSKINRDRRNGKTPSVEIISKENDLNKHFLETMKYVGIEFIPVPYLPKVHFSSQS